MYSTFEVHVVRHAGSADGARVYTELLPEEAHELAQRTRGVVVERVHYQVDGHRGIPTPRPAPHH